jgi:hypothetical protein
MPSKPPRKHTRGLALKRSDRKTEKKLPNASYYNILYMRALHVSDTWERNWNKSAEHLISYVLDMSVKLHKKQSAWDSWYIIPSIKINESLCLMGHYTYEGESNENLKSAIKILNTARLSCKLTTVLLMSWRVADSWQYNAGMQHDGTVVV